MKAETMVMANTKVTDPVCGMQIDPESAAGKIDYNGETFYFCSKSCLENFNCEPAKYPKQTKAVVTGMRNAAAASGVNREDVTSGTRTDLLPQTAPASV